MIERSLKKQAYYQQGKCDPSLKKSKKIPDLAPEKNFLVACLDAIIAKKMWWKKLFSQNKVREKI